MAAHVNRKAALQIATPYAYARVVLLATIGLIAAAVVLGWQDPQLGNRLIVPGALGLGVACAGVAVTWLFAPAAVARERAWAATLPFQLAGYVEAFEQPIAHAPKPTASAELRVQFAGAPATDLPARIRGIGNGTWITATADRITLTSVDSPRALHSYVHDLCDRVLIPLHRDHAIERVTVALPAA